jgi:hypothetical protein
MRAVETRSFSVAAGWIPRVLRASVSVIAAFSAFLVLGPTGRGQELRYGGKNGQQFAYQIEVTVESGATSVKYQGVARYTIDGVAEDQLRLTYRGGLHETKVTKPEAGIAPFGPPGFGGPRRRLGPRIPSFPDPFSRPAFAGKTQTTNRIVMSPRGAVLAMEGDSQLPYLLGNVSLMPFNPLPEPGQKEWVIDSGVSITEKAESSRRPFGPLGPFGALGQDDPMSVQAGRETTRYVIQKQEANQVVVRKSYQLSTPKTENKPAFDLTGSGDWIFDTTQQLPLSLDFSQKLVIHQDNTDVTVPISIKIKLLTAEEIAKLEAEAKRRLEEHQQQLAEQQRMREAPLTVEQKNSAIAGLQSEDPTQVLAALQTLRGRTPKDPDPEVVAAIRQLLDNRNKKIQGDAQETLANWSPEYKERLELNKAYAGHMPVKSTALALDGAPPLYIGQIVQAHLNHAFWYPVEILDFLKDGRVMVRTRGVGAREQTVSRADLQLAPDEVDQPDRPADMAVAASNRGPRIWTNHTGEHKTEATFVAFEEGKVRLRRGDGKEVSVPLDKLSKDDQKYIEELRKAPTVENPFQ